MTIDLPEDVAEGLQAKWDDVERGVLETIALEGYRSGSLTTEQVRLCFDTERECKWMNF